MRFDPSNSINFEWFGAYHEAFYAEYSKTPQVFPFLMDFMGDMAIRTRITLFLGRSVYNILLYTVYTSLALGYQDEVTISNTIEDTANSKYILAPMFVSRLRKNWWT